MNVPQPTGDDIRKMIELQKAEADYKTKELALRKQQDEHNFEYSKRALEMQARENENNRKFLHSLLNKLLLGVGLLLVVPILTVIIVSIVYDKMEIAKEIIKAIVYIALGMLGGFGINKKYQEHK